MEFNRTLKWRVEIYKGKTIYNGEDFLLVSEKHFFVLRTRALEYAERLRNYLQYGEVVRVFRKIEKEWVQTHSIDAKEIKVLNDISE